jgi:hypothetical protein
MRLKERSNDAHAMHGHRRWGGQTSSQFQIYLVHESEVLNEPTSGRLANRYR